MLESITESNSEEFDRLVHDYEEEFSPITGKKKGEDGKYSLDSDWRKPNHGYYWVVKGKRVGFCIKGTCGEYSDISESYIIPRMRNRGEGKAFAFAVFDQFSGPWQVRQIENADLAKKFWREIIDEYSAGNYQEQVINDSLWGKVTCQRFTGRKR